VLIRWDGARQPTVWTVPPPATDPVDARRELARRYLRVFGPTRPDAFAAWAGIASAAGRATFRALERELTAASTPVGDGWILAADEPSFRAERAAAGGARLLPSGDTWFLLQGIDRELLVPDAARRPLLWTPRVWPGAVLLGGEVVGTWRRAGAVVDVEPWRALAPGEREAVEREAESLPLPDLRDRIRVRLNG
jgi:hypothetical protein